jgi:predicted dehydrogenase
MKRRKFIELSATGSAALASSIYLPNLSQDRKLKIGLIGSGWYGMVDIRAALKVGGVEVIALCDVIEKLQGKRPKTFKYYQELLDFKDIEALFIGTIPHWHALQFIAACNKGLDIYCEKPLAYDVMEGLAMVNAANKAGNIVQVGFQRRQSNAFSKAKELIESGRIGSVHQIVAQINYIPVLEDTNIQQPPATLDWEEWCGPAPKLDYRPNIGHKAWRLEKEYGNGHLVDWGIHHIDIIRRIMGEGMPSEFYTKGGIYELKDKITTPDTLTSNMTFPGFQLIWQHRLWGNGDVSKEFNNGIFFYGEKGTLFAEDSRVTVFPAGKDSQKEVLPILTEMMQEKHVENFLKAVRSKDKKLITCNPEDAFKSTATVQLAMISYYAGSCVKWDEKSKTILNNPEAEKLLKRAYRGKYVHP